MATLVSGKTPTDAWLAALRALEPAPAGSLYDLLVEIEDPTSADHRVVAVLDDYLVGIGRQPTSTVANTIFPSGLAAASTDRQELYERYRRLLPRLRKASAKNRRGTYFGRLIDFPLQADPDRANQLELVIDDLLRQDPSRPRRHIYEMQVFAGDRWPEGFPCMSSISVHLDGGAIRLAATYRNQYYIERALGNFIGLAELQGYIAKETGRPLGRLSIHAFHAYRDRSRSDVRGIIRRSVAAAQDH